MQRGHQADRGQQLPREEDQEEERPEPRGDHPDGYQLPVHHPVRRLQAHRDRGGRRVEGQAQLPRAQRGGD